MIPGGKRLPVSRRAVVSATDQVRAANGYPNNPDPLAPARGVAYGLLLAGGMWLGVFLVLLIAFRT
jgi:hypothetical protein